MKDRKATNSKSKRDGSSATASEDVAQDAQAQSAAADAAEATVAAAAAAPVDGRRPGEPDTAAHADEPETGEQAEDLPPLDEVDVLRAERDVLQDKLLRLAAEYDNFRKRNAREWQKQRQRAASDVLREMLEVCDNLERALETGTEDAGGLRKGVELILQQFHLVFGRFGIESFDAEGTPFDPHKHEAVQVVESEDVESQHVVNVVQRGYTLHGEVLRPARVTVSK